MASLNFKDMSKEDLIVFSRKATKAHERPSVENDYFTTRFSRDLTNKQPIDWVPTKLYTSWCEHHSPSCHETAECRDSKGVKAKPAKKTEAEAHRG
jgi:hypothetical protein